MLTDLLFRLRAAGLPLGIGEFLTLLEGLRAGLVGPRVEEFYQFARLALVKDERHYDRFDRAFAEFIQHVEASFPAAASGETFVIPREWLQQLAELTLSPEERARLQTLGWDKLMQTLIERLREQDEAHHGGSKWIGSGGTSPFGHSGDHPEGVRIGGQSKNRRAVKVWERREFRNFDDSVELGTRNLKLALRKLRRFARSGASEEFDLDGTIEATARQGGMLDVRQRPERHNATKVLLFLDVGGSMDDHVRVTEELFSACRAEFKHLEHFYFHNCVYEHVWRDNRRRREERIPTSEVMRTYGRDYRLIIVGDATMSPYEITQHWGSVEHMNEEAGAKWLQRLFDTWPKAAWINPQPEDWWEHTMSLRLVRDIAGGRMYPLTLDGLERAIRALKSGTA